MVDATPPETTRATIANEKAASANVKAAAAHSQLASSAQHMEHSAAEQTDSADRRTVLAANRTVLAAERTYAAWVRTGLAALASGVGARALLDGLMAHWMIQTTGVVLVLFSAFAFIAAIWREIMPSVPPPRPDTKKLSSLLLIGINGFLVLVSIAALVGILAR